MPGLLLVLDASTGTRVLDYYFFSKHPFTQHRVAQLYFARSTAFPRYFSAIGFSIIFAIIANLLNSEIVTATALVVCVVAYGLLTAVSLVRSVVQAGREAPRLDAMKPKVGVCAHGASPTWDRERK